MQPKPLSDRKAKQKFFNDGELEFIETLKRDKHSMNYSEISAKLEQFSTFSTRVPKQCISDALRTRMPSGPFTRKQLSRKPCERFTDENMQYTQYFITYVSQKNPRKLIYFDECGIKLSTSDRTRGHSEKGKKCIEIGKHLNGVNVTLNLLVSLNGICYFNFVDGASNTDTFVNFWSEAAESLSPDCQPTLEPGDVVILDNCSIHRNDGETRASTFLDRMGIEYLFLSTYSPDLNPAENCFGKLKDVLKTDKYQTLMCANLKVAVAEALKLISTKDLEIFFNFTGYLDIQ